LIDIREEELPPRGQHGRKMHLVTRFYYQDHDCAIYREADGDSETHTHLVRFPGTSTFNDVDLDPSDGRGSTLCLWIDARYPVRFTESRLSRPLFRKDLESYLADAANALEIKHDPIIRQGHKGWS
jgi:hypothetical protein